MELNKIYLGDSLAVLKTIPSESVNCCISSPPYWALRSYLDDDNPEKYKELGLEPDFKDDKINLVDIMELREDLTEEEINYVINELNKTKVI